MAGATQGQVAEGGRVTPPLAASPNKPPCRLPAARGKLEA